MSLLDRIRSLPVELLSLRDTKSIAEALTPDVVVYPRLITERGILSNLGAPAGDNLLKALEAFANSTLVEAHPLYTYHGTIKRGVSWLKAEGLDLGDTLTRSMLDSLVLAGILDSNSVSILKKLAEKNVPVDEMDVRRACWSDEGVWQI